MTISFLADENIPLKSILSLQASGIDIESITRIKVGLTDDEILSEALKRKSVIITFDRDFGELIFRHKKKSFGIILLRIHPQNVEYITSILKNVISKEIRFTNSFCVVEKERIRVIPLQLL